LAPPQLIAIHLNMPIAFPDPAEEADWTAEEAVVAAEMQRFQHEETGYSTVQRTRPQTLGYGLTDSPAGQAAWIYEKYYAWSDCDGDPANVFSFDEMLDNIMLYWLPAAGASSARLYWESMNSFAPKMIHVPTGCSSFPKEVMRPSRRWVERIYRSLVHWNKFDRGGHFAAFEQPELFIDEVRACFRQFR
jgi:pimeloyl-ACP methyl ester carboxylesterase